MYDQLEDKSSGTMKIIEYEIIYRVECYGKVKIKAKTYEDAALFFQAMKEQELIDKAVSFKIVNLGNKKEYVPGEFNE